MTTYEQGMAAAAPDRRDPGPVRRVGVGGPGLSQVHLALSDDRPRAPAAPRPGRPWLRWLVLTPLVAGLFAVSFWESWSALTDAAVDAQIPHPGPWPLAVDGFILVTALLIVEARRTGHDRGAWWPRLGLLGATALSTAIQALYAPQTDWAWTLHAWSPLAVLASFECLVWLVFARPVWDPLPPPPPPQPEPEPEPGQEPIQPDPVPQTRPRVAQAAADRKRPATLGRPFTAADHEPVRAWVAEGRTNKAAMARELGLHKRGQLELGRYVNQLRDGPVQVGHPNGDRS